MRSTTAVDALPRLAEMTAGHARQAGPDDHVDGMPARWVASPADTAQTSAVLRFAHESGLCVVPRGSGTKLSWGAAPERLDVLLDMRRVDTLVEHGAGDLIVVAGAGRLITDLQEDLAAAGQRLAVDPTRSGTLGGLVATATSGPSRFAYGPVRDLLIGSTMVRADGVVARSGGKVVKNVAGYDIGKVLAGSFGTLGVLTEVAFRLHPVPESRAWVTAVVSSPRQGAQLVQRLVHSHLVPAAVELDRPPEGPSTVALLLEGIAPGVQARSHAASRLLAEDGGGDLAVSTSSEAPSWWGLEPGGPWSDPGTGDALLKVTHELKRVAELLAAIDAAASEAAATAHVRGSVGVGTVLVSVRCPPESAGIPRLVAGLRARASTFGGTVVVLEADRQVKDQLDVWGPVTGLELMRSVKAQFDPERTLAPGRFVGGI